MTFYALIYKLCFELQTACTGRLVCPVVVCMQQSQVFSVQGPYYIYIYIDPLNSFLVRGDFCCLLIIFANSLDPDQNQHNVGPDLNPNRLTL